MRFKSIASPGPGGASIKRRHRARPNFFKRLAVPLAALLLPLALLSAPTGGQSGRIPSPVQDSRPRRSAEEQNSKPIKIGASLVTVITSVTDGAGNQINDLTQDDFVVYEDNVPQDIAGFYREGQMPLRLVFLFDTSTSIRHRFEFEQRAAALFFRNVMQPGDQAAIISVSTEPKVETQFTPSVNTLLSTLNRLKAEGATALYNALIDASHYLRPTEGRHVMVVLSDGSDTASGSTLAQALAEAQRSDAIIYGVHSTGIPPSANVQDLAGEFVLKAMAEDTGGEHSIRLFVTTSERRSTTSMKFIAELRPKCALNTF